MDLPRIASRIAILFGMPDLETYWVDVGYSVNIPEDEIEQRVKDLLVSEGYAVGDVGYTDSVGPGQISMDIDIDSSFGQRLNKDGVIEIGKGDPRKDPDAVILYAQSAHQ